MEAILGLIAGISIVGMVVSLFYARFVHRKSKKPALDDTAQKLLSSILSGPAVVRIEVIDKGSIIQYRGPND